MKIQLLKLILTPVLALTLLAMCSTAFAQGTATGPFTAAIVTPGPEATFGDLLNPIPIDLDVNGLPWFKSITDPNGVVTDPFGELMSLTETIENVGTEPWFDWHEHIAPNAAGVPSSTWFSVKLSINGSPIGFVPTGLNTADLWLDTFSQPVLPGDIFVIEKEVVVFPVPPPTTGPILRLTEYPTPEPASLGLMGIGSLVVMGRRRADKF
jgi:hypothetical protein